MKLNFDLRKHWLSYVVLITGIGGFAFLYLIAWPERFWLRLMAFGLALFYFVWGWRTHADHGHVPSKVLAEYGGFALLGLSLLWLITL